MIIVRLLSPEPVGWLALPTLLGRRSRHCHGINFVTSCYLGQRSLDRRIRNSLFVFGWVEDWKHFRESQNTHSHKSGLNGSQRRRSLGRNRGVPGLSLARAITEALAKRAITNDLPGDH